MKLAKDKLRIEENIIQRYHITLHRSKFLSLPVAEVFLADFGGLLGGGLALADTFFLALLGVAAFVFSSAESGGGCGGGGLLTSVSILAKLSSVEERTFLLLRFGAGQVFTLFSHTTAIGSCKLPLICPIILCLSNNTGFVVVVKMIRQTLANSNDFVWNSERVFASKVSE